MASRGLFRLRYLWSSQEIVSIWARRPLYIDQTAPLCNRGPSSSRGLYAPGVPTCKAGQLLPRCISTASSTYLPAVRNKFRQGGTLFWENDLPQVNRMSLEWIGGCLSGHSFRPFSSWSSEVSDPLDKRKVQQRFVPLLFSPSPSLIPDNILHFQVRGYSSHLPERRREVIGVHRIRRGKHNGSSGATDKKLEEQAQRQDEQLVTAGDASQTPEERLTLYQRFKKTYKEHGKVLIAVHLVTSAVWFGSFYTAARCGIDIVPYLENWNFSEKIIKPFRAGGLGDIALAYLMYKLATPARYTVTIGGTKLAIRYLQKEGHMKVVPKEDSLRSLYKEGKEDFKRRSNARIRKLRRRQRHKHRSHPPEEK